jgi:hypothetical protein
MQISYNLTCKKVCIFFYFIRKDARLPVQLQRAMAAEAEAAREARAKVKTTFGTSLKLIPSL